MKTNSQSGGVTVIVVVALLVGVLLGGGVGYVVSVNRQTERESLATAAVAPAPTPVAAGESEADRLRIMLGEKETAYAKLREENEQLKKQTSADTPLRIPSGSSTNSGGFGGRGGGNFMDRLRRDDPERAKQMEEEREQRRQQAEARYQESLAKLQERRQRAQSPEEQALVDQLSASLTKLHDIGEGWQNISSLSGSNRMEQVRALMQESTTAYQGYGELLLKDRQMRLSQLATQVGYKDAAQAKQFADSVQKIYEETDASLTRLLGVNPTGFGRGRGGRGEPALTPQ
jgi:hypothetical protein